MEPEPRSNQRLRAYFRPVRIPNFFDRVDHVSLRHSAAWLGFICRHSRRLTLQEVEELLREDEEAKKRPLCA